MDLVKIAIRMNLNLQTPQHRQLLNSIYMKMFARLDASCTLNGKDPAVNELYRSFIHWLITMILMELVPGASMPRTVICLKLLNHTALLNCPLLREMIYERARRSAKQLHNILTKCLFNSFTEVNLIAYDNLIKLQNLHVVDSKRLILTSLEDSNLLGCLRNSTTITMVNGYSLKIKYRTGIPKSTNKSLHYVDVSGLPIRQISGHK